MDILEEWCKLRIGSFLIIQCLILCMTTLELMALPALQNCKDPLGMESGAIRDDQITASTSLIANLPHYARLHGNSVWTPAVYSNLWIQVDFKRTMWVTGLATQGHPGPVIATRVTAYSVQHRTDGTNWQTIRNGQSQTFPGNVDKNTEVRNTFTNPISLSYIRIIPSGWNNFVSLRFELYGCEATWSSWTTWMPCSKTCGSGLQSRTRTCSIPGACYEDPSETRVCNTQDCPTWSSWTSWMTCSKTCGSGQQSRTRTCSISGACEEDPSEARFCNTQACPFDLTTISLRITEQLAQDSTENKTPSTPQGSTFLSKTPVFDLMTSSHGITTEIRTTKTTSAQEIEDEGSLIFGLIIGVAIGAFFILLVGLVAIIWCMKRACNKDKADTTQQTSAKDTKKKEGRELNLSKSARNHDNHGYEPYRRGSEQTTYEELRKIKITNSVNSENIAGKYESILELEPMKTGNQEGKPSNQDIKPGNQGIKPSNQETRLSINLNESDQTYDKINERKMSDKALKSTPGNQAFKPGNQETKPGYQGEIDQTYAKINKGENRVSNGEPPVQNKATLNESLHHTYYDPKTNVAKPVYGNAAVLKFVGK